MKAEEFKQIISSYFKDFQKSLATEDGDWIIKGFIDVYKNIYTISVDTKVISKIIELMLFPVISGFAKDHGFTLALSEHQNHYPDITFIASDGTKFAVDLKSTYKTNEATVNGFTLGAFTGYFRHRESTKNITFPYGEYEEHFVLGIIYNRREDVIDEFKIYEIEDLKNIISVVKDFTFIFHEKWRIASDQPGSGNTKNIGSLKNIQQLIDGAGLFSTLGKEVFDGYWMNYLTKDMAKSIDSVSPYKNLAQYHAWRKNNIPVNSCLEEEV